MLFSLHILNIFASILQGILGAVCRGFMDSLKGGVVLFYLDKEINDKLMRNSPAKSNHRRRETNSNQSPVKPSKQHR